MKSYTQSNGHYGVGFALMAHVLNVSAEAIVRSDVSSISYEVFPYLDANRIETDTLTVSEVIFNTLQTDNDWPEVAYPDGYNFLWAVPGALVPKQATKYRFIIDILLADGEHLRHIHDHTTLSRLAT